MSRIALSVGANLGDRLAALDLAVTRLREVPGVSAVRVSPVYETDPVGGIEQPDFLNLVVVADLPGPGSPEQAHALLDLARRVEAELERRREVRWGPRTVDVDVLAVGQWQSTDPELTVPHPRIAERAFVLVPWAAVDPHASVPGHGTVAGLLAALPDSERATVRPFT